jgi:hypothetical protein
MVVREFLLRPRDDVAGLVCTYQARDDNGFSGVRGTGKEGLQESARGRSGAQGIRKTNCRFRGSQRRVSSSASSGKTFSVCHFFWVTGPDSKKSLKLGFVQTPKRHNDRLNR